MVKYQKIIEYPEPIPVEHFKTEHLAKHKPCIIRNCSRELKIQKWNIDYIQEKCGENEVFCRWQTNNDKYQSGVEYQVRKTTVGQYIDDLKTKHPRSQKSYLAVQNVKHMLPQLEPDIDLPPYIENLHSGPFVWIAKQGHYEYAHIDPDEGFLIILHGRKTCRLFSYENLNAMKPRPRGALGRTIQSGIDLKNEEDLNNLDKTCFIGELNSTDALYIPGLFWHQITTEEEDTVSVNCFWGQNGEKNVKHDANEKNSERQAEKPAENQDEPTHTIRDFTIPNFSQRCILSQSTNPEFHGIFKYWFTNIIEQNRDYPVFQRQLSRWRQVVFHFLYKQWKEKVSEEEIDVLVEITKQYLELKELPERKINDLSKYPPVLKIRGLLYRDAENKHRK